MATYKGLPGPVITDHLSREASRPLYAGGTTFQIGKIEMVANTGTYVDAPSHRWEDGADLSELPLDRLAGLDGDFFEGAAAQTGSPSTRSALELARRPRLRRSLLLGLGVAFWGTP